MAVPADLEFLAQWRIAAEVGPQPLSAQQINGIRAATQQQIAAQGIYVAEMGRPVAMINYDIWLPDSAQLGRVVYSPALTDPKEKGPAAIAALEAAVSVAATHGVKHACILIDPADTVLLSVYRPLGFTMVADFGTFELT